MKHVLLILSCLVLTFSYSQTYNGSSGSILDLQSIDIPLTVSGLSPNSIDTSTFGLEQICLDITHSYVGDISIDLIAPDGTTVNLFSNIGGNGQNFQNTCLNSIATNNIGTASAPFTGFFKSTGEFGMVNNTQDPNGTWLLRIVDNYNEDEGTLNSWSLTFGSNPASYFSLLESDLPIVVINTNGQTIEDDPKIIADMGIIYNGAGVRNHIADPKNNYNGKIGIEIRGNYSASLPQKPYAFELQDVNGNQIDSSLIGMPKEHDWLLLANYNDKSFARNIIPYHLFDSMGHYATRNQLVDVVINGTYKGIYLLCEKIKRDNNRIDIAKLQATEIALPDVSGGYIVKIDYWDNTNSWQLNNSPIGYPGLDIHMVYYYPKPADLMPQQISYIQTYIDDFETALYGTNFSDPFVGYRKYIDVPSFIDYFLISELTRNQDGYKKSRFFYKDKDQLDGTYSKLKAGPVWDFDWAAKDMNNGQEDGSGFMYGDVDQDVDAPGWYIRLLEDPIFQNEVKCRYENLRLSILSQSYLNSKIDSVANIVNESQEWHYNTWGNMGQATGTGEVQAPSQTYAEEVQRLKDWFQRRLTWLDANLPGTLNGCSFAGEEENETIFLNFDAYPNPFNSSIQIHFTTELDKKYSIKLIDQVGRIIKEDTVQASENKLIVYELNNLSELQKGVYFVEISDGSQKVIKKMTN